MCIFGGERAASTAVSRGRAVLLAVSGTVPIFWDRAHSILDGTTVSGGVEVFLTDLPTEGRWFLCH